MKAKEKCRIVSQECIASDIYSMWLQTDKIAKNAVPGQFVSLYTRDGSKRDRQKHRNRNVFKMSCRRSS